MNGLKGIGLATNIWTWELHPNWTIHVTFTRAESIELVPLSNLIGNISRYGMDLPPRPQALVMNYGLHFNMLNADINYQQILKRLITKLQQQLSALGGDRTVVIWRRIAMTHFNTAPLSSAWKCRSPDRIYELDQIAMGTFRSLGFVDYILDTLALTETRPDGTVDNRHYEPKQSNVPFIILSELIHILSRAAPLPGSHF